MALILDRISTFPDVTDINNTYMVTWNSTNGKNEKISVPRLRENIPNVQPDWNENDSTQVDYIKNKPDLQNSIIKQGNTVPVEYDGGSLNRSLLRRLGSTPNGAGYALLISPLAVSPRPFTGASGKLFALRGGSGVYRQSWDGSFTIWSGYTAAPDGYSLFSRVRMRLGTCDYNTQSYVCLYTEDGFASQDLYFDGIYTNNCTFSIVALTAITNFTEITYWPVYRNNTLL